MNITIFIYINETSICTYYLLSASLLKGTQNIRSGRIFCTRIDVLYRPNSDHGCRLNLRRTDSSVNHIDFEDHFDVLVDPVWPQPAAQFLQELRVRYKL